MHRIIGTVLGKGIRQITRLGGTGGQALPGLVVERIAPGYLASMLKQLPEGVVIITGTNGKTTTTKIVTELLRSQGKRVLTNPTGSNYTRGITSILTQQARLNGRLPFDIGVFELDEAYARHFVKRFKPRWVLALNVMRDQLDRFGELDTTAKLISTTMQAATHGVIVNGDDARLTAIKNTASVGYFGVAPRLRRFFPLDDELVAVGEGKRPALKAQQAQRRLVELRDFKNQTATFTFGDKHFTTTLQLTGQHNFQNAAAALAMARALLPNAHAGELVRQLSHIAPAFGRGERFTLKDGSALQLILVKNPAGLRQTLASYPITTQAIMFAVNDNYADGRDVSWLWDVDFSALNSKSVALTSGSRAADMALRLSYDSVQTERIEPNLNQALQAFCQQPGDKLLITTYTAMLRFYKLLKQDAGRSL